MDIFERLKQNAGGPIGQYQKLSHGYYSFPKLEGEIGPHMIFRGREVLNWSLNNYLGLANHPEVRKADAEAAAEFGMAYPMGARMMSGQTKWHEQLERELGVRLFDRIGKNVSITQYGKNFISYARDIVSAVARAQVFASEETELTGMVQVGTLNSLMTASFSDIVPAFRQRFPHVMMRLHADMVASLKDKLLKNELDLIYTLDSQVLDPQFVKVFEAEEEVVVVTNRDNPLAARESVRLAELVDHPFILMNRTNAYRDLFDTELARQGLEIRPFLELEDDVLALRLLYENPAYMTVLPLYTVKKSIHEKSLAAVRVEDCKMSQFRQVIYHKNKVLTPQIQGMLDTIVEVAKRPF